MTTPLRIPRPQHCISRDHIDDDALSVLYRLKNSGFEAYLVGGAVRDLLAGKRPKDFDVATDATPSELRGLFRHSRIIGRRFRIVHVCFGPHKVVEVATLRSQVGPAVPEGSEAPADDDDDEEDGEALDQVEDDEADDEDDEDDDEDVAAPPWERRRKPRPPRAADDLYVDDDNQWGDVESDAFRRDFTINGLYYDIRDFSIVDYVGGVEDIRAKRIRSIGDPLIRFREDPVRMLRAVKFAARFGYEMDPATDAALRELPAEIHKASGFRVTEEIFRIFTQANRHRGLNMLAEYGLLTALYPTWMQDLGEDGFEQVQEIFERIEAHAADGRYLPLEVLCAALFVPFLDRIDPERENYQDRVVALTDEIRRCAIEMDLPKRLTATVISLLRGQLYLLFFPHRRPNVARYVESPEFDWVFRLADLAFGHLRAVQPILELWLTRREALGRELGGWVDRPDRRDIFSFRGRTGGGRHEGGADPGLVPSRGGGRGRRRGGRRRR
jgi:tRNA nucleotidyltransferase/poly(A) polymerase